ncbi:hypothetical protein L7F22_051916 [Adiantum nelumboides]|nr:hypothetical protein [Adiantum nelumboides]
MDSNEEYAIYIDDHDIEFEEKIRANKQGNIYMDRRKTQYLKVENLDVINKWRLEVNTIIPNRTTKEDPPTLEFEGYDQVDLQPLKWLSTNNPRIGVYCWEDKDLLWTSHAKPGELTNMGDHAAAASGKETAMANKVARRLVSTVSASSISPSDGTPILVRDFIRNALYHPTHGYFSVNAGAVGILPEPMSFSSFKGRRQYMQRLNSLYRQNDISWFTPVELFKRKGLHCFDSRKCITDKGSSLQIYEIGGGTGTCAKNILDYMKTEASLVYDNMRYVSVEISETLAKSQLKTVYSDKTHKARYSVERRDACRQSGWAGEVDESPCFVILLEHVSSNQVSVQECQLLRHVKVLDNQPHDLIYKKNFSCSWLETSIMKMPENGSLVEVHKPVEDPLVQRCINIMESQIPSLPSWLSSMKNLFQKVCPISRKAWIPTASLQLLEGLYSMRPNLALIVSDFSVLPDVQVQGERAPLVASKKDGVTKDHSSYLDVKGDADIFFPTDFQLLRKLDRHSYLLAQARAAPHGTVYKTPRQSFIVPVSKFMRQYADISKTETKDGFNPLLDDYSNMQFFLTRSP